MDNKKCEKQLEVGDAIIFYDEYSVPHNALVTQPWGERWETAEGVSEPGCNLVFVSSDVAREDSYGRQIERTCSCVHAGSQPAPGFSWSWPEEKRLTKDS